MKRALLLFLIGCCAAACVAAEPLPDYGAVGEFAFTERSGRSAGSADLAGSVWIADFIFTRCQGPCPLITAEMAKLQRDLPEGVKFASFSVDPGYDSPETLARYAAAHGADPARWLFFTGEKPELYAFIRGRMRIGVEENAEAKDPGEGFIHSLQFVLVDGQGRIRGTYTGTDAADLRRIREDARRLHLQTRFPVVSRLPALNAGLNALCALLLITGYRFIRAKNVPAHRACMLGAFVVSAAFLASYLTYHAQVGSVRFLGQGWVRPVYFAILITHTVLAALIVPLAGLTLYHAWKQNIQRHVRLARWTLPLWLYVSVTGVTIYLMLYGR